MSSYLIYLNDYIKQYNVLNIVRVCFVVVVKLHEKNVKFRCKLFFFQMSENLVKRNFIFSRSKILQSKLFL